MRLFSAFLIVLALLAVVYLVQSGWVREMRWSFKDSEEIFNDSVNGRDRAASLAEHMARRRARHARRESEQVRELQVLGRIHAGRIRDQGPVETEIIGEDLQAFPFTEDEDPELAQLTGQLATLEGELGDIIPTQFMAPINAISEKAHVTRRKAAVKSAHGKKKAKVVLEKMETHSSIPENVHDRAVIEDMGAKMRVLKETTQFSFGGVARNIDPRSIRDQVSDYIANSSFPPDECERALASVQRIYEVQSFIMALDAREDQVLELVWTRADHPQNSKNRDLIRDAIVVALRDCWVRSQISGEYEMVCPNGRAERCVESLVLLDFDTTLSGSANTSENYKNEIYRSAQDWNEQALSAARGEPGGELLWRSYQEGVDLEDLSRDPSERQQAEQLEQKLRDGVLRKVDIALEKLKSKLPAGLGERIRGDVEAALNV